MEKQTVAMKQAEDEAEELIASMMSKPRHFDHCTPILEYQRPTGAPNSRAYFSEDTID